jgi:HEAT repeat protein
MIEEQVRQHIEELADEHVEVREDARAWLLDHADISHSALAQIVVSGAPNQRTIGAIRLLGEMSKKEDVPVLELSLQRADPQLLWESAQALGQHTAPVAIDTLLAALQSTNVDIVSAAAVALGTRGDEQARKQIEQLLAHPDEHVRYRAIYALRQLGVEPSAPALRAHAPGETSQQVRDILDKSLRDL